MDLPQQLDLACLLETYWPLVVAAHPAGLPMKFIAESAPKVAVLQSIGVLDMFLKVDDDFNKVVSEVANGRGVDSLTRDDFRIIASLYAGWYRAGK
ncbi:hypothetical protein [Paraburkholderia unamae]|uniref:Uncharacterized protein n=1 Tax=Paraburkholderia unamae TaxID=219649 RepID=A0ABX5KI22_9BURK|nr:hypothetical protein [Paraburkholderia unamae]PVX80099.1 hypothetical protein C7402_112286 [Paraburkholderia unamae]CAG9268524.1 hypothetical protein PUN4_560026 [Paraburkholderia unamae]